MKDQQSRVKELIALGKERGYLTYGEINDHLPEDLVDADQVEDIVSMFSDLGIMVHEDGMDTTAPDLRQFHIQIFNQCVNIVGFGDLTTSRVGVEVAIRALAHTPGEVHIECQWRNGIVVDTTAEHLRFVQGYLCH